MLFISIVLFLILIVFRYVLSFVFLFETIIAIMWIDKFTVTCNKSNSIALVLVFFYHWWKTWRIIFIFLKHHLHHDLFDRIEHMFGTFTCGQSKKIMCSFHISQSMKFAMKQIKLSFDLFWTAENTQTLWLNGLRVLFSPFGFDWIWIQFALYV